MCKEYCLSMGSRDSSLLDLIEKLMSCIPWGDSLSNSISREFDTNNSKCNLCFNCQRSMLNSHPKYGCQSCGRPLCEKCAQSFASLDEVNACKLCYRLSPLSKSSPRRKSEPSSPSFSGEQFDGHSHTPRALTRSSDASFSNQPSRLSLCCSTSRSDDDDDEGSTSHFFSTSSEYFHDASDVDFSSISALNEVCSFMSVGSSPSDSPSRIYFSSNGVGLCVKHDQGGTPRSQNEGLFDQVPAVLEKPTKGTENVDDQLTFQSKSEKLPQLLDFGTNTLIWLPPPPDDVDAEMENFSFIYDDEDDEVGNPSAIFSPTFSINPMFLSKEKRHIDNKESLRAIIQGHFRALVCQLFEGEGIIAKKENFVEWLDIVTALAWQAAKFIKPDTGRGGSMDPYDYVKVKCLASGSPNDSKLIKGIVFTKNIKHKRMTTQYKNARLLLLGGPLEYQRAANQLASFDTLLQQENDHLKTIVSKIEARRPNVLLVEKNASSFAQEHLLSKEISLVSNVKRPILERIARCTGATITSSTDHISRTRLGNCELFHLEKISENHEAVNQFNKKPSKTLMFLEGCPRRLGCTVVLRGSYREELKKVKQVVQLAVFAAYHLSLETSFLADEGASLPKMTAKSSHISPENMAHDKPISVTPELVRTTNYMEEFDVPNGNIGSGDHNLELGLRESLSELDKADCVEVPTTDEFSYRDALLEACDENLALNAKPDEVSHMGLGIQNDTLMVSLDQEAETYEGSEVATPVSVHDTEAATDYYSLNDSHGSILVSFSSHCMLHGTVCERSRLLRVKFYGPSDKPLGRYLRDDLFDKSSLCLSCNESAEAHVICYTHLHENLTINIKRLPSAKLPGERDGKIWMWHRCLRCAHIEGVPPATRRVVMSDAAWGLSFGKFLELSFSNHATGNRVASCGHSLQRDCLRFYGFGDMVALFQYSPINVLSVHLSPPILEFGGHGQQSWIRKEAAELLGKAESLFAEISGVLQEIEQRGSCFIHELYDTSELDNHVLELNDMLAKEKNYYNDLLELADKELPEQDEAIIDILEINCLRHSLLVSSRVWDQRLYLIDSLLKNISCMKAPNDAAALITLKDQSHQGHEDNVLEQPKLEENPRKSARFSNKYNSTSIEQLPSAASIISDKIDSSWSGADLLKIDASVALSLAQANKKENPSLRKLMLPSRVYSFDSALRLQEKILKEQPSVLHLSAVRSFHASGDYRYMVRDPVSNLRRTISQVSPRETETPSFISSISLLPEGARLIVPQNDPNDILITIYDDEPTSIISYALSSKEYEDRLADRPSGTGGSSKVCFVTKMNSVASDLSTWQSFASLDLDYTQYASYEPEDVPPKVGSLFADPKSSAHLRISFEDESSNNAGKVKFSVTCYFAKQFDALRGRCCPSETDFIRSLSRCKRWSAQGGKSNVYFAKSFDERFIIKQVTKTELESFNEFSTEYFKYLTDALSSGSPTCLAKVLGVYQVVVKTAKGGKEVKMDLMVMENLFYERKISKVYDLKGSARSRYISDTDGTEKVLLDTNLVETLQTNPIFLGSKAKRILERAVWNDTSFLAAVDVMDYSLLVGVDEGRNELVVGIIDFMRQYTWDKHLETWVKASGILGGPKNASPTIISPKQYKKRFRKAMTAYFLTVPDQ